MANNGQYNDDNAANGNEIEECPISFMDTSIYYFPSTSTMRRNSRLDFGVMCQPLQFSDEIPLVNFPSQVIRCCACRAYINPFIEWVSNGVHNHWICNLCGKSNKISEAYYNNYLAGTNCKELQCASVEIVAPDEYCVRPPQCPSYLFIINVNKALIGGHVLRNICDTIKQILSDENMFNDERIQIGFITYSDTIHFYSLSASLTKPRMIVVNDVNDALLPLPSKQIMANLSESYELITHFLTILPTLHTMDTASSENALGTALECGFQTLKEIGGKIICFSYGLPCVGKGKVMDRSMCDTNEISEYDKLLKRSNNFFMDLAVQLTKYQISCDLFQFTADNAFVDISSIKGICRCSGGQLLFYNDDHRTFCQDLYKLLTRNQGWESVMRIRVSKGVRIKHYYGCFYRRSADLLSIPTIDSDKTVTILLEHTNTNTESKENAVNIGPYVYIQSALLYTNNAGQRRIRCCTKRVAVTSSYDELYENVNMSVMTALIAKQAVFKMLSKDIASARMFIQDSCVTALKGYHKELKSESDYPLAIRYWPLNTLGLLKCIAFADMREVSVSVDRRIALLTNMLHINHSNIELLIRPSLYRIDGLCALDEDTLNDEYYLPLESPLTLASMAPNGIYLLDNGQSFIVRIGKNVTQNIISTFIANANGNGKSALRESDSNKYIYKLNSILQYLQSINYRYQTIQIISESQTNENKEFCTIYLIRDRTDSVMNYSEFFTFISKQTKPKLSNGN